LDASVIVACRTVIGNWRKRGNHRPLPVSYAYGGSHTPGHPLPFLLSPFCTALTAKRTCADFDHEKIRLLGCLLGDSARRCLRKYAAYHAARTPWLAGAGGCATT
jgi:hypothetical protein